MFGSLLLLLGPGLCVGGRASLYLCKADGCCSFLHAGTLARWHASSPARLIRMLASGVDLGKLATKKYRRQKSSPYCNVSLTLMSLGENIAYSILDTIAGLLAGLWSKNDAK